MANNVPASLIGIMLASLIGIVADRDRDRGSGRRGGIGPDRGSGRRGEWQDRGSGRRGGGYS